MDAKLIEALSEVFSPEQVEAIRAEFDKAAGAKLPKPKRTKNRFGPGFVVDGLNPTTKLSFEAKFPIGFFERRVELERKAHFYAELAQANHFVFVRVHEVRVSTTTSHPRRSTHLSREIDK